MTVDRPGRSRRWRGVSPILGVTLVAACSFSCQHADPPAPALPVGASPNGRADEARDSSVIESRARGPQYPLAISILDPRLEPLVQAADHWRRAAGPTRLVVDQVYLVPDVGSFFEVIAGWDERNFFPVLIDDPHWSLPFLRAFRPARVVRVRRTAGQRLGADPARGMNLPARQGVHGLDHTQGLWQEAERAVARAWTSASATEADLPPAGLVPRRLGPTPPGLVFSNPESPMLAGAVALAAGRFQPLVRLDPVPATATATAATNEAAAGWPSKRFHDVLPLAEARGLARLIESRAAAVARPHDRLGDACDFLTLAADWPYRYRNDAEAGLARGEHALDDLIGRVLDTDEGGLASSRSRWAFTGRLLGDPAASVYRAMCALFLQPEESLLWDTYEDGAARSAYRMTEAAAILERLWPGKPAPVQRAGAAADLSAWHEALDPVNRFGWIMVNSSGMPRQFSISGGSGCPADLPRGLPAAVAIIHSFSAADPLDVSTLAGRWLENGAFVYYGSMNEPYLPAFRPPKLVAELAAAEMPLGAALRQGPSEPYGRPWRLVYLGDPLYRFHAPETHARRNRISPGRWKKETFDLEPWDVQEITAAARPASLGPLADGTTRLHWCLTEAIRALCQTQVEESPRASHVRGRRDLSAWEQTLASMDRALLEPPLRPVWDELLTDTLLNAGQTQRLFDRLQSIPPEECDPRASNVIETLAMSRLAELADSRSFPQALDLWDALIHRPWPAGSEFPAQLTGRLAAVVDRDPIHFLPPYRERLRSVAASVEGNPGRSSLTTLLQGEWKRLDSLRPPGAERP